MKFYSHYQPVKIVLKLAILKDWLGCNYGDTHNLLDLYNGFVGFGMLWFIKCIYIRPKKKYVCLLFDENLKQGR